MTGYINNSIYSSYPNYGQQQYAQNFGMANPQQTQQFTGFPAQTFQDPTEEPGLFATIFNPLNAIFLPLTVGDPNVKKYIKAAGLESGVDIGKKSKAYLGFIPGPTFTPIKNFKGGITVSESLKNMDFKGLWNESIVDPHNKELYTSLIKEGKLTTAEDIFNTAHKGLDIKSTKGVEKLNAIKETMKARAAARGAKGLKSTSAIGNGLRELVGTGTAGKILRRIPVLSTALFSIGEVFEVSAASKFGTTETVKQLGRSTATVAGDVTAFSYGTAAGAKAGAKLGRTFGAKGALVGGAIGGLVGGLAASHVVRKAINFVYDGIFGKQKHKEAEKQEALLAQQQAQQEQTQQTAFGSYTQPQQQQAYAPQFQGGMPAMTGNISLGDENMLSNMNSAYNMYQFAA